MNRLETILDHLNLDVKQVIEDGNVMPFKDISKHDDIEIHVIDDEGIYKITSPSVNELITLRDKGKIKKLGITLSGMLHALRAESDYTVIVYQREDKKYYYSI